MSGKRKHVPQRTCVVCRQKYDKRQLVRLIVTKDGLSIDLTGRKDGRGAYLCMRAVCWDKALHTQALSKALKTAFTEADRLRLSQFLQEHIQS